MNKNLKTCLLILLASVCCGSNVSHSEEHESFSQWPELKIKESGNPPTTFGGVPILYVTRSLVYKASYKVEPIAGWEWKLDDEVWYNWTLTSNHSMGQKTNVKCSPENTKDGTTTAYDATKNDTVKHTLKCIATVKSVYEGDNGPLSDGIAKPEAIASFIVDTL